MEEVRITDPRDLPRILDWIHDQYFDVEKVTFDPERSLLTIPFHWADYGSRKPLWNFWVTAKFVVPTYQSFLRFHHVDNYQLRDTEGIRFYSFNELRYEPSSRRLSVQVNERLEFWATVREFDISFERTDSVTDPGKPIWSFLLMEFERAPRHPA